MFGAGFIIHGVGFGHAYLLSATGHILALGFLLLMRYQPHEDQIRAAAAPFGIRQAAQDVREGLAYARGHSVVLWVIVLLVAMMSLGFPATANLGPTWITTVVGVPTRDMGFVVMNWGIGSLIAAIGLTWFANIERRGLVIAAGALLFSLGFMIFVADHRVANAVIGNLFIGAGMTLATVSSTILIQKLVPNEVRGRIMSIFQLNMGAAQLMTMPIAILAQTLTLPVLFPILALITLAAVVGILLTRPQVLAA
jgi:hypothetical protein